jgi:hypothetical protein
MAKLSIKEIQQLAKSIVLNKPGGIRYSTLMDEISHNLLKHLRTQYQVPFGTFIQSFLVKLASQLGAYSYLLARPRMIQFILGARNKSRLLASN